MIYYSVYIYIKRNENIISSLKVSKDSYLSSTSYNAPEYHILFIYFFLFASLKGIEQVQKSLDKNTCNKYSLAKYTYGDLTDFLLFNQCTLNISHIALTHTLKRVVITSKMEEIAILIKLQGVMAFCQLCKHVQRTHIVKRERRRTRNRR